MSGDNQSNQYGVYGIKGVASAANKPGARRDPLSWSDASGNLWLFGGSGWTQNSAGFLNDLWKYNVSTGLWTWVTGDSMPNQRAIAGTRGIAAAGNKPGGRYVATGWTDASGNFWLFGGQGYSASGSGELNDLWKYNIATGQWTWISGDLLSGQTGVYGTRGTAGASTKPGARYGAVGKMDASGNIWLFGGNSRIITSLFYFNDLWKYTPSTDQWTWVSGDNVFTQPSVYGSKGIANTANKPGARASGAAWITPTDDIWLFGGTASVRNYLGALNDLWKYNISTGLWTWVGGDTILLAAGVYGTKGVAAPDNRPGARQLSAALTDASGNFLLYGGSAPFLGEYNDLWRYSLSSGQWTWLSGDNVFDKFGVYGTKGVATSSNNPGGRTEHVGWLDPSGYLWIFGGLTYSLGFGISNDLWRYTLTAPSSIIMVNGFTAQKESQAVTLNWTSTPNQNISSFVVERYDGTVTGYQSIGTVPATGSSLRYSFTDNNPLSGTNFYRIRQVDQSGSAAFSSTAQVDMSQYGTQFSVYQNPVQNVLQLVLQLPAKQKVILRIRDMSGHVLIQQEQTGYAGRGSFAVPIERLNKGTYLIQVQSESINSTKTFIKQ